MDVAALLATLLTQTPLPSPSGAAPAVDGTTGISQWLPLGTALLAAGAAIGASALTQFLSARHEGSRRREQYKRDDLHRRREELKVAYSELISHLNDYLIQSHKTKGVDRLIDQITRLSPDPAGRQAMTAKQTELTEKMIVTVSAVNSLLSAQICWGSLQFLKLRRIMCAISRT